MANHNKCILISIEGIDGSGKTTHSEKLEHFLLKRSLKVMHLHFPDFEKETGKLIKKDLMGETKIPLRALFTLFTANRLEHRRNILNSSSELDVIIFDRYSESEIAYGLAYDLPQDWLYALESQMPPADLVILLDVNVEEALDRINRRSIQEAFKPNEGSLSTLREKYMGLVKIKPFPEQTWVTVNTTDTIELVHTQICNIVTDYLDKNNRTDF